MREIKLKVQTKNGKYPIIIGSNLSSKFSKILKKNKINFNQCFLIIDKKIGKKKINKLTN